MSIKVIYEDGTERSLSPEEVSFSGFDSSSRGVQTILVRYGAAETSYAIRVLYDDNTPATISVSFTLLGAKIHHGEGTTQTLAGKNLETWIPKKTYTVSLNATVWDLLQLAVDTANNNTSDYFTVSNRGNYVESISKNGEILAEFTNGPDSGWMYTLNGKHPLLGVEEQFLERNDAIVFHYSDDHTKEEGSQQWNNAGGGGSSLPENSAVLAPKVTAKDGIAEVSLSASALRDALAEAAKKDGASIVIRPEISGAAKKILVALPKASLTSLAAGQVPDLILQTNIGTISLPKSALSAIAAQASGTSLELSIEAVDAKALSAQQRERAGENGVYEILIRSGNQNISSFDGKAITLSLPYTLKAGEKAEGVRVWYLNADGQLQNMNCTYDKARGLASFTTTHLSRYMVGYDAWTNPFTDVKTHAWYYDAVKYAVEQELFTGITAASFHPEGEMTRGMLVTVLYRLEGKPAIAGANNFADVKSGQWYTDAVLWATEHKIVEGYGGGLFGIQDAITREQMAAILYRYAQYKTYDTAKTAALSAYSDAAALSPWAHTAMEWAVAEGLITGITDTLLNPSGNASRAQVAAIFMRFGEKVMK